jgi:hypothetical protein
MRTKIKMPRTPAVAIAAFLMLLIVAPLTAAPITPTDLGVALQSPPIVINGPVLILNLYLGETPLPVPDPGPPAEAVTVTVCGDLMASINAAAGQADPFELQGADYQQGDGCAHGVPARQ